MKFDLYLLLLICLELFEVFWQRGDTFREYVKNLYSYYERGVLLFILLHPSFFFMLFICIKYENYSFLATVMIVLKALDISVKISLLDKLYNKKDLGIFEVMIKENYPLPFSYKLIGVFLYPVLFYFSFYQYAY